ncbi:ArsR/SmtB family transcription factor [Falsihalocynthiibacter arcticus]|uniref:ArsR family transcriptional regulator n=1 Tax=Falsihalocynthiibacter arcticus TaxID=1579316 RepID=A0A126UYI9_9RHOB|nr:metalloregulator ArsR/SmtB family transcription factor [Falsihalocynthiibacter arcticus]AML50957.1 ArsR family transcriptional regulator [Falsihalocynthiibacter arcticus]
MDISINALDDHLDAAAHLMNMLSQPVRLKVLCHLLGSEKSVQVLTEICGLSQPAMSHHLAKLRAAELVKTRRDGQTIYYSVASKEAEAVLSVLHKIYCAPTQIS